MALLHPGSHQALHLIDGGVELRRDDAAGLRAIDRFLSALGRSRGASLCRRHRVSGAARLFTRRRLRGVDGRAHLLDQLRRLSLRGIDDLLHDGDADVDVLLHVRRGAIEGLGQHLRDHLPLVE